MHSFGFFQSQLPDIPAQMGRSPVREWSLLPDMYGAFLIGECYGKSKARSYT